MDTNGNHKLEKLENMLRIETTREHAHQQHGPLCLMVALCSSHAAISKWPVVLVLASATHPAFKSCAS